MAVEKHIAGYGQFTIKTEMISDMPVPTENSIHVPANINEACVVASFLLAQRGTPIGVPPENPIQGCHSARSNIPRMAFSQSGGYLAVRM